MRHASETSPAGRDAGISRGVRSHRLHRLQSLQSLRSREAGRNRAAGGLARERSGSGQASALQGVQLRRREDHDRAAAGRAQRLPAMSAAVQLMTQEPYDTIGEGRLSSAAMGIRARSQPLVFLLFVTTLSSASMSFSLPPSTM